MKASSRLGTARVTGFAAILTTTAAFAANPIPPNPCKLITVPEMQQIVGPLSEPPRATDPAQALPRL